MFLLLFIFTLVTSLNYRSCKECTHYMMDDIYPNLGRCKLFQYYNKREDRFYNDFILQCRKNEIMCGKEARFFEDKNEKTVEKDI